MRQIFGGVLLALVMVAALFAMLWGFTYSVPDLVRISYGIPMNWGINTLNTIAGPVNRWSIDLIALTLDLVFWFATLILVQFLVFRRG